jgi:predicted permease
MKLLGISELRVQVVLVMMTVTSAGMLLVGLAAASSVESRSLYDFQLWREQLESIKELGAYRSLERNLITESGAQPVTIAEVSASAFPLTRVAPLLGRILLESDAKPGAAAVAVIGYDVWQARFNGTRDVIGLTVRLGRTPATIVGVMPEGFRFPVSHDVWVPLRVQSTPPREGSAITVFGRLADGATLGSAQSELAAIGQRSAAANPQTHAQLRPRVALYGAPAAASNQSRVLRLSNIAAWLILIAASMNVATLMFARIATREAEIIMRSALGASRYRVMMQLFVEALVLCAAGALVGLTALAFALDYAPGLLAALNVQLPFWWQFRIGPATIIYSAILAVGGAALVGLLPAARATAPRLQSALTRIASGSTSMRFGGVWSVMIVLQVAAVSLCLPIAIHTAFDTLRNRGSRVVWPSHEYLTFRPELDRDTSISATGALSAAAFRDYRSNVYAALKRRLEAEPSVAAVTFANGLPGLGHPLAQLEAQRDGTRPVLVNANTDRDRVWIAHVDNSFFDTFRLPLVAGRAFQAGDMGAQRGVIINETLARNIGGNALGVRLRYATSSSAQNAAPWFEVVGIVRDAGWTAPSRISSICPARRRICLHWSSAFMCEAMLERWRRVCMPSLRRSIQDCAFTS